MYSQYMLVPFVAIQNNIDKEKEGNWIHCFLGEFQVTMKNLQIATQPWQAYR